MKKTFKKPLYTVDIDQIETLDDIDLVWALSKHNAGLAITDDELKSIIERCIEYVMKDAPVCQCIAVTVLKDKKQPWYKRLWNWAKKPFTKKK